MLARFFVDRPIFATVISVVIVLAGLVAVGSLPVAQYPEVTPPTVQVTALYPGANAETVRDTVAAPIEEQVSGVEGMMYMSSRCTNDGAYNLTVTFKLGTDSDMAQVLVQNRLALALPVIPQLVQNEGIVVRKMSPNTLMIVNLISPDNSRDSLYLSNYATVNVRDELGRLDGVAGVTYLGQRDYSLRVWLDADKMASLGLAAMDVVAAIAQQNVQVAAGQIGQQPVPQGQQFQLTINTKGRLVQPEEFADIVLKSGATVNTAAANATGPMTTTTTTATNGAGSTSAAGSATIPSPAIVRLKDVARVEQGSQQYDQSCTLDGKPSVALNIYQLPGSNALDTASNVYAKMKELKTRFPDGVDYDIVYDTTPFISESVNEVFYTLRDAVILVAIVVLFFLQDWRAMILPMIDVPVSLIGTFAVMALMGFTLNNLTLFGLVLAIGIVVDDAIVVLENIERQIATGLDPRSATIKAMDEITGPVLAITLVLSSGFIPCWFLPGVTGQFFKQFAVTIAVSTMISAVNALTMTPSRAVVIFKTEEGKSHEHSRQALPWWIFGIFGGLLTAWLLPKYLGSHVHVRSLLHVGTKSGVPTWWAWTAVNAFWFTPGLLIGLLIGWYIIRPVNAVLGTVFRGFNRVFDWSTRAYGWGVANILRIAFMALFVYVGLLLLTWWEFNRTPTGFIPQQDKGYLILNVQLPDSASVERTERSMAHIERQIRDIDGVQHTVGVSGKSLILDANAPNLGSMYIMLKPFADRNTAALRADAIARAIQDRCHSDVREAIVTTFGAPPIDGLGTTGGFKLIVEDRTNLGQDRLQAVSDKIVARGANTKGLQGMFSSSAADTPWLYLEIDRTQCMALGVQVSDVFNTLQVYLGSYYVNNFNNYGRTWQVNVQADPKFRYDVSDIKLLQVKNNQGQMIRLGAFMDVRDTGGPVMIMRYNLYSATAITGDAAPGNSSGQAMDMMQQISTQELPPSMAAEWTDLGYLQQQAGSTAMYFFFLSVSFVFLVLAAQYESWKLPLAVILVVPMCLLCSVVGLQIAGLELNIFTQIGFVVLVGLASKNAILIVEFAKQQQEAGVPRKQATLEACRLRLRPILMTSFAFILGVMPLVIASGAGAEMRQALGIAVFAGMLGVTFFGVFLTPIFFYVIQGIGKQELRGKASGGQVEPAHQPTP
ncbi:MAG TPA: efflux RND transporter permease subunit [Gemmataceae bacterium]|jgi:multidrug efflux pump subunit AcrB|nr:efflux RND transporter permease subunit [Gemmataceae bacterium]